MKQPTFFTRQDMERIAEGHRPCAAPSDEIARQIEENDIRMIIFTTY
jgi:hypothetical protein